MEANLYVVPTPIGNLQDMTYRGVEVLKSVDVILCEDTRITSRLTNHFDINTTLRPLHKMNEYKEVDKLVQELQSGKRMALVSDAGTPIISDPGQMLISSCIENDVKVSCLPGATAFVPALVNSGFDSSRFTFLGFPPHKKGRQTFMKSIDSMDEVLIIYESPYRLLKFLKEYMEWNDPERRLSISREISKKFEETLIGKAQDMLNHFTEKEPKGEFVVIIDKKKAS